MTWSSPAATGHTATVGETGRAGVTRKHGQTDEISLRLQFGAEFRIFFDSFTFALFALEPASFSHRGGESAPRPFFGKGNFSLAGDPNGAKQPAPMISGMLLAASLLSIGVFVFIYLAKG